MYSSPAPTRYRYSVFQTGDIDVVIGVQLRCPRFQCSSLLRCRRRGRLFLLVFCLGWIRQWMVGCEVGMELTFGFDEEEENVD